MYSIHLIYYSVYSVITIAALLMGIVWPRFVSSEPSEVPFEVLFWNEDSQSYEPLANKGKLYSGDLYKIRFKPLEEEYVYVFQIDSGQQAYCLFPSWQQGNANSGNFNPVRAERAYYIPAEEQSFMLDDQTGKELFYFYRFSTGYAELEAQCQAMYDDGQPKRSMLNEELQKLLVNVYGETTLKDFSIFTFDHL